jgi:hypothetical protein
VRDWPDWALVCAQVAVVVVVLLVAGGVLR